MKTKNFFLLLSVPLLLMPIHGRPKIFTNAQTERTITDDNGKTFTTTLDKPTIVTWAHTAISLFSYGLDSTQLLGTYGEWITTGSDLDVTQPEKGSRYPFDPTKDELELLRNVTNLSPSCEEVAGYCVVVNFGALKQLDPDFVIVHGYRNNDSGSMKPFIEALGEDRVMYHDISLSDDDGAINGYNCSSDEHHKCFGKSMIEMIEDTIEFATFLNLDQPPTMKDDLAALCESAQDFADHMKVAQEKGIRTMAAYLTPETSYFASATDDMVLRMFEELGMPILHVGACPDEEKCPFDYFWEWIPIEEYFNKCGNTTDYASCNEETLYPIDVWLYDYRSTRFIGSEDFRIAFPDRALIQKQYVAWPQGGVKITPQHAKAILDVVGPAVSEATRLYPPTDCTSGVNVSGIPHRTTGLPGGAYACYDDSFHNSKYFEHCEETGAPPPPSPVRPEAALPSPGPAPTSSVVASFDFFVSVVVVIVGVVYGTFQIWSSS